MLCEIKKRKRRKNCFVYFHDFSLGDEKAEKERELKQTIKIGETTSFSRISSKPREFELSQFFSSTNSKHRLLYCRWFLVPPFFFPILIFSVIDKKKKKSEEQTRYHLPFPNLISLPRAFIHRKNPSDVDARSPFMRAALLKIHPGKIQRWRNIELRNINISFLCCRSESGANFFQ